MKLTNKILLIAFVAILIATTAFAIKLTNIVEYTPQPFKEHFDVVKKRFSKLREIEISGEYNIQVIADEKDSLELFGPDLLIKKHSVIEEQNGSLKIKSKVNLSNYPFIMSLKIYARKLELISLKNGAFLQMYKMNGDSIRLQSQDSSVAKISNGHFKYARIEASGKSMISLEKAGSASFNLKDESVLIINSDKILNERSTKEPKTEAITNKSFHFDSIFSKTFEITSKTDSIVFTSTLKMANSFMYYHTGGPRYTGPSIFRDHFRALKLYRELLMKQPSNVEVITETANCLGKFEQNQIALQLMERAYNKNESNIELLANLVWRYRVTNKPIEANKYAERLVKKYPNHKMYLETYAMTLLEVGELAKGEKTMQKLQEMAKPNEFEILRLQGIIDIYKAKRKTKDI